MSWSVSTRVQVDNLVLAFLGSFLTLCSSHKSSPHTPRKMKKRQSIDQRYVFFKHQQSIQPPPTYHHHHNLVSNSVYCFSTFTCSVPASKSGTSTSRFHRRTSWLRHYRIPHSSLELRKQLPTVSLQRTHNHLLRLDAHGR